MMFHLLYCSITQPSQSVVRNVFFKFFNFVSEFNFFSILGADAKQAVAIKSQLQHITRAMYSSPPVHGILLVSTILSDPYLKELWEKELKVGFYLFFFFQSIFYLRSIRRFWYAFNHTHFFKVMVNRIHRMRSALRESLEKLGSPLNWDHITKQVWHLSVRVYGFKTCLKRI